VTKSVDGTEVSKKQMQNNEKELAKHVVAHKEVLEKGGEVILQSLSEEIAALR